MGLSIRVFTACLMMLMLAVLSCRAATAYESAYVHKDHPNKCWNSEMKKAFDIGEQWPGQDCVSYVCTRNKGGLFVQWSTCGKIFIDDPSCTLKEDLTLNYPLCCPQPVCRDTPQTNGKVEGFKVDLRTN